MSAETLSRETVTLKQKLDTWLMAGMLSTPIRLVIGWLFFSALWRRLILRPEKLDPNATGYIGEQMNHFLPNALWIQPMLEYLVTHIDVLHAFLIAFTLIEGAVGLALLLGFFTRFAALGVSMLSWGILIGAGWLGTTCLDEWQIGASGIAMGLTVMLTGAGPWSIDHWLTRKYPAVSRFRFWHWLTSGPIPLFDKPRLIAPVALGMTVIAMGWTLYTYQVFFDGIWGNLHNPSAKPHITLSNPEWLNGELKLRLYRDGGPDTYGAFLVDIVVQDAQDKPILRFDEEMLSRLQPAAIRNHYLVKTRPGKHSLVVPLGSKSDVRLKPAETISLKPGRYQIIATDVSGMSWSVPFVHHKKVAQVN